MRPRHEPARDNQQTYFVTFQTAARTPFFRHERWAQFFLNVLQHYRAEYLLHDFVIMPDHIHLLLTPKAPVERPVQLLKGGFSSRAKRNLQWNGAIWQAGFTDHRLRDSLDVENHKDYIARNAATISKFDLRFLGASSGLELDEVPPRLKPQKLDAGNGGTEDPPLQNDAPL